MNDNRTKNIADVVFHSTYLETITECRQVQEEITICELDGLSESMASPLLASSNTQARFSPDRLINVLN